MKVLIVKTVAMKWKGGCIHRVQSYEGMLGGILRVVNDWTWRGVIILLSLQTIGCCGTEMCKTRVVQHAFLSEFEYLLVSEKNK